MPAAAVTVTVTFTQAVESKEETTATGDPAVNEPEIPEGASTEEENLANTTKDVLAEKAEEITFTDEVLKAAADATPAELKASDLKAKKDELAESTNNDLKAIAAAITVSEEDDSVSLEDGLVTVKQAFMEITPKAPVVAEDGTVSITFSITPKVQVLLTTKAVVEDENKEIIVLGESNGATANAVIVGEAQDAVINDATEVTLPVAASFQDGTCWVKHTKANATYLYRGTIVDGVLTFISKHGFSDFTISTNPGVVAEIDGEGYTSLADAVAAVKDKGTIKLLANNAEVITVNRAVTFTIDNGEYTFTGEIKAADGFKLAPVTNGVYKFTQKATGGKPGTPGGTVTPTPDKPTKYVDVPAGVWYVDAVKYVTEKALMIGTSDTEFSPAVNVSRAMVATILYCMNESPSVEGLENPFSDVAANEWYTDAILWCNANGVMLGYGNDQFGTTDNVTREQLALIFMRNSENQDETTSVDDFSDANQISDWALKGMQWAVATKLIQGTGEGLNPLGNTMRCELAQVLMNYLG